jgi:hypothetical protein
MSKTGQVTMVGLIFFFILIVMYTALLPAINTVIATALPELDDMSALILQFTPLIITLVIIASFLTYGRPSY